jgi:hypothetical protein
VQRSVMGFSGGRGRACVCDRRNRSTPRSARTAATNVSCAAVSAAPHWCAGPRHVRRPCPGGRACWWHECCDHTDQVTGRSQATSPSVMQTGNACSAASAATPRATLCPRIHRAVPARQARRQAPRHPAPGRQDLRRGHRHQDRSARDHAIRQCDRDMPSKPGRAHSITLASCRRCAGPPGPCA